MADIRWLPYSCRSSCFDATHLLGNLLLHPCFATRNVSRECPFGVFYKIHHLDSFTWVEQLMFFESWHALHCAGAPWSDNASTEWLNSVLLELYRHGKLPRKSAADETAHIGGRQGADRAVEQSNGAASEQLAQVN